MIALSIKEYSKKFLPVIPFSTRLAFFGTTQKKK